MSNDKIIISTLSETDLIVCKAYLCKQMQKEFDMSPILLESLINDEKFSSYCKFLYDQCYSEFINLLNTYKEAFINALENHSNIIINDDDYKKCGKPLKIHKNGYIEYCNIHKYIHVHSITNDTSQLQHQDHIFVNKDDNQIIKEYYNVSIYILYQNYLNKLFNLIKQVFCYLMQNYCEIKQIMVDNNNLNQVFELMTNQKNIFKSKFLYKHINTENEHIDIENESQNSYYYMKVYTYLK